MTRTTLNPHITMTATEFRADLRGNLDTVHHQGKRVVVTRNGSNAVAVIPMTAYSDLVDAELRQEYASTVRHDQPNHLGITNVTLDELALRIHATVSELGTMTVELAGGDAAAIALVLTEYRAEHAGRTPLTLAVDMLLRRLGSNA